MECAGAGEQDGVCTDLYGDEEDHSYVRVYRVDETASTFSLEQSFPVPYCRSGWGGRELGGKQWSSQFIRRI